MAKKQLEFDELSKAEQKKFSCPKSMEILLRAIIDQYERPGESDAELPSYFVQAVKIEFSTNVQSEQVKIDWGQSCLSVTAPYVADESEEERLIRELGYQKTYLPVCGAIKEQQVCQLAAMLDESAKKKIIASYQQRYQQE